MGVIITAIVEWSANAGSDLFFLRGRLGVDPGDGVYPNDMIFDLLDAWNVFGATRSA